MLFLSLRERKATTVERQLNRRKYVFSLVRGIWGPYEEAVQRESRSLDFATLIFSIFDFYAFRFFDFFDF